MELTAENKLRKLIVVGDRVLIRPKQQNERTKSGLFLPPGVQEKEKIQEGYIVKVGPGFPIPVVQDEDEPWKDQEEKVKYIPLQAQEGDKAIFLLKGAYEIQFEGEKFFVVPQNAVLMLEREEDLFD